MVSVGVIGLGVGKEHLRACLEHPDCADVWACDLDGQKLEEAKKEFPKLKRVSTDASDILKDPAVDIVCIASYDNFHCQQILTALKNGKHVFVEKPVCLNLTEAIEIREAVAKSRLKISANHIMRSYPRFTWLKRAIEKGELGRLYLLEGDYNYGRIEKIINGWRGKMPGYSAVLGGALHLIDLIWWICGDTVEEVFGWGNNIVTEDTPITFFDNVSSLLRFKNGVLAKIGVNFGCVYPHFHKLCVYGTKATFENGLECGYLFESRDINTSYSANEQRENPKPREINQQYPGLNKGALMSEFISAVVKGSEPLVKIEEIFKVMSVCFAIEESSKSGKPVKVKYF